jgi:hypothetical protein
MEIHDDVENQNQQLDQMGQQFNSFENQLKSTFNRLRVHVNTPQGKRLLWIVGGLVAVFCLWLLFRSR